MRTPRVLVALSVVAATSGPCPSASRAAAPPRTDTAAYAALVEEYVQGDGDAALREIVTWKPEALTEVVGAIATASIAESNASVQARAVLGAFPAAVMLHTEAGLLLNGQEDSEGAALQWRHALRLAELYPLTKKQAAFLRAWYRAFGLFCLSSYGVDNATSLLKRGVQRFPDDLPLALALGQVYEARGTFWQGRVPSVHPDLPPEARKELRTAEALYREVLSRDPLRAEARLRLGRCLSLSDRADLALPELQRCGSSTDDARLRYLALLFAGDLHRRESRLPEARQEFARAVEAWSGGQAAALSLAEALHALGERAEAGSALEAASAERGAPLRPDPFRSYSFGDRAEHRQLLEGVRAMARGRWCTSAGQEDKDHE